MDDDFEDDYENDEEDYDEDDLMASEFINRAEKTLNLDHLLYESDTYDTRFIWQYESGKFWYTKAQCHRRLIVAAKAYRNDKPVRLYSALALRKDTKDQNEIAQPYWDWLFSDDNPLVSRAKISNIQFYSNDERRFAFSVDVSDDTAASFLAALCFASRLPMEHPGILRTWDYLTKERKYTGRAAFVLSHAVYKHKRSHTYAYGKYQTHTTFEGITPNLLKNFILDKPEYEGRKLRDAMDYSNISGLYDDRNPYEKKTFVDHWSDIFPKTDKTKKAEDVRVFAKFFKSRERLNNSIVLTRVSNSTSLDEFFGNIETLMKKENITYVG